MSSPREGPQKSVLCLIRVDLRTTELHIGGAARPLYTRKYVVKGLVEAHKRELGNFLTRSDTVNLVDNHGDGTERAVRALNRESMRTL